jgi:hypothetical protein
MAFPYAMAMRQLFPDIRGSGIVPKGFQKFGKEAGPFIGPDDGNIDKAPVFQGIDYPHGLITVQVYLSDSPEDSVKPYNGIYRAGLVFLAGRNAVFEPLGHNQKGFIFGDFPGTPGGELAALRGNKLRVKNAIITGM